MNASRILSTICLTFTVAAIAQEVNPYNGTWRAEFESAQGAKLEGTVVIKDQGGSWDMLVRKGSNPCVGREAPITVQKATADELVFEINRSKVIPGCNDGLAKLKRTDDKSMEGVFDKGRKVKLIRQ
ncbi:MAG: hypothetical protein WA210_18450 [Burkholderiaceae bacterium]